MLLAAGGAVYGLHWVPRLVAKLSKAPKPGAPKTVHPVPLSTVLTVVAALALLIGVYAVRRLRLRWLAWRQGPIDVPDLVDGTTRPTSDTLPVKALSARFRGRLASVRLRSAEAQPVSPSDKSFVTLVADATSHAENPVATAARLLGVVFPRSAVSVQGLLQQRDGDPLPYGVSVQVRTARGFASRPREFWAVDWETAIDQAAFSAASYLLPRSRACRHPPWTGWRGTEIKAALVELATHAEEQARGGQLSQALASYREALVLDPANLGLRLELSALQERLGLELEAYVTYGDALRLAAIRPGVRLFHGAWVVWRVRARTLLVARYRRAILLGYSERLAALWLARQARETRVGRHSMLMSQLRQRWSEELKHDGGVPDGLTCTVLERTLEGKPTRASAQRDLTAWLAAASANQLRQLVGSPPWWATIGNRAGLSRASIKTAIYAIELQARRTRGRLTLAEDADPTIDWILAQTRMRPWRRRRWEAHYNAACALAARIPLEGDDDEARYLTRLAVRQLGLAVAPLDSGDLARWREWILTEDPDLAPLREREPFLSFAALVFSPRAPSWSRPDQPARSKRKTTPRDDTISLLRDAAAAVARAWAGLERTEPPELMTLRARLDDDGHVIVQLAAAARALGPPRGRPEEPPRALAHARHVVDRWAQRTDTKGPIWSAADTRANGVPLKQVRTALEGHHHDIGWATHLATAETADVAEIVRERLRWWRWVEASLGPQGHDEVGKPPRLSWPPGWPKTKAPTPAAPAAPRPTPPRPARPA